MAEIPHFLCEDFQGQLSQGVSTDLGNTWMGMPKVCGLGPAKVCDRTPSPCQTYFALGLIVLSSCRGFKSP